MGKKKTKANHYVDSDVLEACWAHWLENEDEESWKRLNEDVYKICQGVAVRFNPRDPEEHVELTHETYALTIEKIRKRKLVFEPGRAPVFNLLTTTIMRHLYSLKNKENRRRRLLMTKYVTRPGVLEDLICASSIDGGTIKHPDGTKLMSSLMSSLEHEAVPASSS